DSRSIPLTVAGPCGHHTQLPPPPGAGETQILLQSFDGGSTGVLWTFYNGLMSRSSVVTVRETPVAKTTSASAGGFAVVAETIDVDTSGRIELVDLTDTVMGFVRG